MFEREEIPWKATWSTHIQMDEEDTTEQEADSAMDEAADCHGHTKSELRQSTDDEDMIDGLQTWS